MSNLQINLPKTAFSMKANLPVREPEILEYWQKINLYKELRNSSFKILFLGSWLIVEAYLVSVWGSPLSPYLKFCITFLNPCVGNLEIVFRVLNCLLVVKNKN